MRGGGGSSGQDQVRKKVREKKVRVFFKKRIIRIFYGANMWDPIHLSKFCHISPGEWVPLSV
jgi:hypothetical protein